MMLLLAALAALASAAAPAAAAPKPKPVPVVTKVKSNTQSFWASGYMATETEVRTCYDYEDPNDDVGHDCVQPCAGTYVSAGGYVDAGGAKVIDLYASYSNDCGGDNANYASYSASVQVRAPLRCAICQDLRGF
jgi:hypothetical protein